MPTHPWPSRLALLITGLIAVGAVPSAAAWTCIATVDGFCEPINGARDFIYETTGILVDVLPASDGYGVIIVWSAAGQSGEIPIVVCVRDAAVWISQTGCDTSASSGVLADVTLP